MFVCMSVCLYVCLYGMVWYGMVWYGMVWYGMVWYGMVWYGMVWYGMVWYGMVWYGMVWYVCMYVCIHLYNANQWWGGRTSMKIWCMMQSAEMLLESSHGQMFEFESLSWNSEEWFSLD